MTVQTYSAEWVMARIVRKDVLISSVELESAVRFLLTDGCDPEAIAAMTDADIIGFISEAQEDQ